MSRKRPPQRKNKQLKVLQVDRREAGMRLDLFLVTALPELSRKQAKRLVDGRRVAVNGRIETLASRQLRGGERVEVQLLREPPSQPPQRLTVVFEDDHCVAVDKPPGLPSGPTRDPARLHAARLVSEQLGQQLTLLHRLDKDTSGVLLLAKTREFTTALADAFKQRRVDKLYLALACGRRPSTGEVTSHLREGEGGRMHTVRSGGVKAATGFRRLASRGEYHLVEAAPRTGRTHQIRVHLAASGCPILGDALYGGDSRVGDQPVPRQMLHAVRLGFVHPVHRGAVEVHAPLPPDFCTLARAALGNRLPAPLRPFLQP